MNIVFYSHEVGAVSHVLTGKWRLPELRAALMKNLNKLEYESQPGKAVDLLRDGFEKLKKPTGVENQIELAFPDLKRIMAGQPPAKKEQWVMIEMPWLDITVGGDQPTTVTTKQKWMSDWCDEG